MKFEGFCTYPHGHATTLGLLVGTCGAFAAIGYAFASCKFVIIEFTSRWGPLEDVLGAPATGGDQPLKYKAAAGLFQWLEPTSGEEDEADFTKGTCSGYRTTMLEALSEPTFEAVRVMAVVSVLLSIMMICWILMITTLSMQRREIVAMGFVYFVLLSLTSCTFLLFTSSLCTSVGDDTSCTINEGSLVAIAGCILWLVCFLISCIFIQPLGRDLVLMDGELKSAFSERQAERQRAASERQAEKKRKADERRSVMAQEESDDESLYVTPSKATKEDVESQTPRTLASPAHAEEDDGEGMEVAYNSPMRR